MRIGELSKVTGVSVPTIRLYEKEGLIGPSERTPGQFREFTYEHERRLRFIKRIRDLGFSLDEVKALLAASTGNLDSGSERLIAEIRQGVVRRRSDLALLEASLESSDPSSHVRIDGIFEEQ